MDERRLQRINDLTIRYGKGIITPEEQAELDLWLDEHPRNRERFQKRISEEDALESLTFEEEGERRSKIVRERLKQFLDPATNVIPIRRTRVVWYASSAAILLLLVTGLWLITKNRHSVPTSVAANNLNLPAPGGNRAILQLADGSRIDLTQATKGVILANEGNAKVIKRDSGQVSYVDLGGVPATVAFNTIFTPRGGTYRVVLPDGTIAWLNAESSLRFPTSFKGSNREIEMTGEGYFEVAKNKSMPFFVKAGEMRIKVLGTNFNLQTYADEKEKRATLVDGSISVETGGRSVILRPGEQARIANLVTVEKVDTDEAIAWKEGYFMFNHADIQEVMRQFSRWYNVKVIYEGQKTERLLTGRVSRKSNADDVLEILKANGYHFSVSPDAKSITILQ